MFLWFLYIHFLSLLGLYIAENIPGSCYLLVKKIWKRKMNNQTYVKKVLRIMQSLRNFMVIYDQLLIIIYQ